MMFDMLFVKSSHPLSVCISILDEKCKRLTDRERVEVKEKIEPGKRFVVVSKYCCFVVFFFLVPFQESKIESIYAFYARILLV